MVKCRKALRHGSSISWREFWTFWIGGSLDGELRSRENFKERIVCGSLENDQKCRYVVNRFDDISGGIRPLQNYLC